MQGSLTSVSTQAGTEVNWILHKSCQCGLPYDFTVLDGYFTCASGYAVYRAKINTHYSISVDMTSLKANLTNFLTGQDRNAWITINGRGYLIEPWPYCTLTLPTVSVAQLIPHAEDPSSTAQATVSVSSAPQDNTALIAVVASMCGAVVLLMIIGCITFLVTNMRKK